MTDEAGSDGVGNAWFADVVASLRAKPPDALAHEPPGLVDALVAGDGATVDHFVVGVSFTKDHDGLDYTVDEIRVPESGGDPVVETIKPPASESHRYVSFVQPPDPHFDAAALRARLLAAVDRARREAACTDAPADLWEEL